MVLYRYYDSVFGCSDRLLASDKDKCSILLDEFNVEKETLCGYWIIDVNDKKRWVSKSGRKRYAYPSVELAKSSFIIRKNRQVYYAKQTINRAERALRLVEKL